MTIKIAFLGWGSLYWDPGTLRVSGDWQTDGPLLPIEFARITLDGRLSLVIYKDETRDRRVKDVQVLWVEAQDTDLDQAKKNLAYREFPGLANFQNQPNFNKRLERTVGSVLIQDPSPPDEYVRRIKEWGTTKELDAVVWTALRSNWDDPLRPPPETFRSLLNHPFSCRHLKIYLKRLKEKQQDSALDPEGKTIYTRALEAAERYIRFAPMQVKTSCRAALEIDVEFRWTFLPRAQLSSFKPIGINTTFEDG